MNEPTNDDKPPMRRPIMRLGGPKEDDPFATLKQRSKAAGFDMEGADAKGMPPDKAIERGMQQLWDKDPTDDNADLIDGLAQRHGLTPPWKKGK